MTVGHRDIGREILEGLREINRGAHDRILNPRPDASQRASSKVQDEPPGGVRSDCARVGKTVLVGFNEDVYSSVFG